MNLKNFYNDLYKSQQKQVTDLPGVMTWFYLVMGKKWMVSEHSMGTLHTWNDSELCVVLDEKHEE